MRIVIANKNVTVLRRKYTINHLAKQSLFALSDRLKTRFQIDQMRYSLEEAVVHVVCDLFRPCPVDLVYLFSVGVVSVQPTELALHIPAKQNKKV